MRMQPVLQTYLLIEDSIAILYPIQVECNTVPSSLRALAG